MHFWIHFTNNNLEDAQAGIFLEFAANQIKKFVTEVSI